MQDNEILRITIAFVIVAGTLFAFGFLYFKRPGIIATEMRLSRKKYPPEYREGARAAYLRQIRAIGLGLIMGGFACVVLFVILMVNPSLMQYMRVTF